MFGVYYNNMLGARLGGVVRYEHGGGGYCGQIPVSFVFARLLRNEDVLLSKPLRIFPRWLAKAP